jgi:hypothetical protein
VLGASGSPAASQLHPLFAASGPPLVLELESEVLVVEPPVPEPLELELEPEVVVAPEVVVVVAPEAEATHWLSVHVSSALQVPQLIIPPQLSEAIPH